MRFEVPTTPFLDWFDVVCGLKQADCRNRLLTLMSREDFTLLAPDLRYTTAGRGTVIAQADDIVQSVHFPESGFISVVATSPEGVRVEVGLVGREGFGPGSVVMGSDRVPHEMLIQGSGTCYRITAATLVQATDQSPSLRKLLLRYMQVLSLQASFTALSNAIHTIDERLARWILMVHDRSDSDDLQLTHEFIAVMLAVRRPSVTSAIHVLEGNRFITAERGYITVRNRQALEEFAGDAYGKPETEYLRLIGPMTRPDP